uniref:FHF complex subunit HOOK-interacting protein 1B n=1 Tax=Pelusios castaneus TaxID=367368 RepID=A0A8C8SIT0_9SAUR
MERMSWFSKLHPRAAGHRPSRSASLQSPATADPETCLMVFKNHWCQVLRILEKRGSKAAQGTADDLSAVRNNTYQMLTLLAEERPRAEAALGPILEFVVAENLLDRLLLWHLQGDFSEDRKGEQLKLYEMLISQGHQPLLRHQPVRDPLVRLLSLCAEPASPALESSLVLLLNQLCVSVAKEPALLELFFHSPTAQGPGSLLIFSLLIPFIHHEGLTGQQARDALLLLMAVSASSRTVAEYITDNSYFCPVLATGLSALYSSLPRKIEVRGDDWHCLRREDWIGVASLVLFMNSLEFCNAVIQVAHPLVQKQLVDYIHNGFLVPVMGPALHKTAVEELIASTAYLDLFLRSVSEPALLRTFLRFVLLHRHDHGALLDTLVTRIASSSRVWLWLPTSSWGMGRGFPGLAPLTGGVGHGASSWGRGMADAGGKRGRSDGRMLGGEGAEGWWVLGAEGEVVRGREEGAEGWWMLGGEGAEGWWVLGAEGEVVRGREEGAVGRPGCGELRGDGDGTVRVVGALGMGLAGPFVAVLFSKLENMLHNSLYTNCLLTGLVAQLACYPQPLLRSFLLNTNMVFQPSVKSLLQVLGSVKNKIESFAAAQEDFPALLFKARKYLLARSKLDWADAPNAAPALRRSETLVKSRKPSIGELILRHTHSPTRARQAAQLAFQHVREGQVLPALASAALFRSSAEKQSEALRVKNAVYCAVIFSEFLKELAAIAQAHGVTSPFLLEPAEE